MIQLTIHDTGDKFVIDGKEIYSNLNRKGAFTTWVKRCINNAELTELKDFRINFTSGVNKRKGRMSSEYMFTIEGAKQLCLVTKSSLAKEMRLYLIRYENGDAPKIGTDIVKRLDVPVDDIDTLELIRQSKLVTMSLEKTHKLELQHKQLATKMIETEAKADEAKKDAGVAIDYLTNNTKCWAAAAWASKKGYQLDSYKLSKIGLSLSKIARGRGLSITKIHHPYYPNGINIYPKNFLEEFEHLFQKN